MAKEDFPTLPILRLTDGAKVTLRIVREFRTVDTVNGPANVADVECRPDAKPWLDYEQATKDAPKGMATLWAPNGLVKLLEHWDSETDGGWLVVLRRGEKTLTRWIVKPETAAPAPGTDGMPF